MAAAKPEPPQVAADGQSDLLDVAALTRVEKRLGEGLLNSRERGDIDSQYKWDLTDIFADWPQWQAAFDDLDAKIGAYAALQGTLAQGAERLLAAMKLSDDIGQLTYKVWYFASLKYDEDQRDNAINARRQQVQILFAKATQASAWFNPELLKIPLTTVQEWMTERSELALYRFAIEDLYRGRYPAVWNVVTSVVQSREVGHVHRPSQP